MYCEALIPWIHSSFVQQEDVETCRPSFFKVTVIFINIIIIIIIHIQTTI